MSNEGLPSRHLTAGRQQRWGSRTEVQSRAAAARMILQRVESQEFPLEEHFIDTHKRSQSSGTRSAERFHREEPQSHVVERLDEEKEEEQEAESGPLLLRQLRNSRLGQWENLESLPVENVFELGQRAIDALEAVRAAAQEDVEAVLNAAVDCWKLASRRGEELYAAQAECEELDALRRAQEGRAMQLERQMEANEAAWREKLSQVVSQLDAVEGDRDNHHHGRFIRMQTRDEDSIDQLSEIKAEQQRQLQKLYTEVSSLQATLATTTARKRVELSELEDTVEELQTKLQEQQRNTATALAKVAQVEKEKIQLEGFLADAEKRLMQLNEQGKEDKQSIADLKAVVEALRADGNLLYETMGPGSSLLNELHQQTPPTSLVKEDEPRVFRTTSVRPVILSSMQKPLDSTVNLERRNNGEIHIHLHQHRHCHQHAHHHKHEHYHTPSLVGNSSDTGTGSPEKLTKPPVVWRRLDLQALDKDKSSTAPLSPVSSTAAAVTVRAKQHGIDGVALEDDGNVASMFVQSAFGSTTLE